MSNITAALVKRKLHMIPNTIPNWRQRLVTLMKVSNKGCTLSIVRDREFSSSKLVLEDKAKQLAGRGKRPNKARQVSEEEEEVITQNL